jgi:hypothetical protein
VNQQLERVRSPISGALVAMGAASIAASIGVWASTKGGTPEERAHAERFGIFIGLWAPTFFILADFLSRPGGLMSGGATSGAVASGGATAAAVRAA